MLLWSPKTHSCECLCVILTIALKLEVKLSPFRSFAEGTLALGLGSQMDQGWDPGSDTWQCLTSTKLASLEPSSLRYKMQILTPAGEHLQWLVG